jgi:nitrite reductase/ring-hydroxylating ferredoxin subunit
VLVAIINTGILFSCDTQPIDSQIPYKPFNDIVINLTGQQYLDLNNLGYVLIDEGGVKGIILYKNSLNNEYSAYERNCSYQPNNTCATVEIDSSTLYMIDPCCSSQFSFQSGEPIGGPASLPLRQYRTYLNGNILTITDDPL